MRQLKVRPPCCVRNCHRTCQAENEFCLKCWTALEDEERAGYLFARHAPFWARYRNSRYILGADGERVWLGDEDEPGDFAFSDPAMPDGAYRVTWAHGTCGLEFYDTTSGTRAAAMVVGIALRELEHRTTRDAIAEALWSRKWRDNMVETSAPQE